jgi:hypothetical protein
MYAGTVSTKPRSSYQSPALYDGNGITSISVTSRTVSIKMIKKGTIQLYNCIGNLVATVQGKQNQTTTMEINMPGVYFTKMHGTTATRIVIK